MKYRKISGKREQPFFDVKNTIYERILKPSIGDDARQVRYPMTRSVVGLGIKRQKKHFFAFMDIIFLGNIIVDVFLAKKGSASETYIFLCVASKK